MVEKALMDRRLALDVSEPWKLTREEDARPPLADVKDLRQGDQDRDQAVLLLELQELLEFDGVTYKLLVAELDGGSPALRALSEGVNVEAHLYGIPLGNEIADPLDPSSWWRGGLGMIGSLRPA